MGSFICDLISFSGGGCRFAAAPCRSIRSDRLLLGLYARPQSIIFIEKRWSLPCELAKCFAFRDLSVGPAMFFSRRWILCCRTRNTRTACLICCCSSSRYGNHPLQNWMPCCRTRTPGTARLICCCSSMRNRRCPAAGHELQVQPARTFFLTHKASKKG